MLIDNLGKENFPKKFEKFKKIIFSLNEEEIRRLLASQEIQGNFLQFSNYYLAKIIILQFMQTISLLLVLLTYKQSPSEAMAQQLSEQFDSLFATTTGYDALDIRIEMTREKKKALLLVLAHTFLPLHNNGSELGTRV